MAQRRVQVEGMLLLLLLLTDGAVHESHRGDQWCLRPCCGTAAGFASIHMSLLAEALLMGSMKGLFDHEGEGFELLVDVVNWVNW